MTTPVRPGLGGVRWTSWILRAYGAFNLAGAAALASVGDGAGRWLSVAAAVGLGGALLWSASGLRRRDTAAHRLAIAVSAVVAAVAVGDGIRNPDHLVAAAPIVFALWTLCRPSVRSWFGADDRQRDVEAADERMSQLAQRRLMSETPDLDGINQRLAERKDAGDELEP